MARRGTDRWDAHPVLAWWVRLAVVLVPVGVSVVVVVVLAALLPRTTTWPAAVGWWSAVLGGALLAAQLVDRLARRALPLAALLTLSLVFPDQAPSRLRAARATSLREIERQVSALEAVDEPAEAARTLVSLVAALGSHDKRTRGHSERVRAYVDLITEELGLHESERVRLRWAALLHDIGKLTVPGSVLNGGSHLAEEEWAALRAHPAEGERLAVALLPWLGEWGLCVRQHHERWDGHGYPAGLVGTEISRGARIVAVADAYEVMTANRSYRKAVSPAAARKELLVCAGTDFDPAVVRAFLQVSIGRLRWVLGPFGLLPALPFSAAGDRAAQVLRGLTSTAAAGVVALGLVTAPLHPAGQDSGGAQLRTPAGHAPVLAAPAPAPAPLVTPVPSPAATPSQVRRAGGRLAPSAQAPVATPGPAGAPPTTGPTPAPAGSPAPFLAVHMTAAGLVSAAGSLWLDGSGPSGQVDLVVAGRHVGVGPVP